MMDTEGWASGELVGVAAARRMALYIDAENLLIAARDAGFPSPLGYVIARIKREGVLSFAKAYGDWSRWPCSSHLRQFQQNVIELQQLPTDERGKNTADILLALDALEMILSPNAPEVMVLACADRDFVPLVQKAKRYGKTVFGIGVRGSVSNELASACDRFFLLDDIIPDRPTEPLADQAQPAPGDEAQPQREAAPRTRAGETRPAQAPEPTPPPPTTARLDRDAAFSLMRRAVELQRADGLTPMGSRTLEWMKRESPEFDFRALGFEQFRDCALAAERAGFVKVLLSGTSEMQLDLPAEAVEEELIFSTPQEACESYRQILLEDKRVPLVKWAQRRELVAYLWERLEATPDGMTITQMNELLKAFGRAQGWSLPDRAYDKIVHTLNIAWCFADRGHRHYQQDLFAVRLKPATSVDEALTAMHETYVQGVFIERQDIHVDDEGFAMLLYDDEWQDHVDEVARLLDRFD